MTMATTTTTTTTTTSDTSLDFDPYGKSSSAVVNGTGDGDKLFGEGHISQETPALRMTSGSCRLSMEAR